MTKPKNDVIKHDKNGLKVYSKISGNGKSEENWYEYDDQGRLIKVTTERDGHITTLSYVHAPNVTETFNSEDFYTRVETDDKGRMIYRVNPDGSDESWDYDDINRVMAYSYGNYNEFHEYDEDWNEIHYVDSNGWEEWKEYEKEE